MSKLQFKLNKKSMIIWILILNLMIIGFMAFFPTMADEGLQALMEGMSDSILQVLGFETFPDFSKIDQFYGYIIQYVTMALFVYAITLGLNTFIKEEKDGTIEYLYSLPQTRRAMITSKLIGNIQTITLVLLSIIISSLGMMALLTPPDMDTLKVLMNTLPILLSISLWSYLLLLLGTGLSLVLKSDISCTGVAMAIVFIPYVIGMMSQMVDVLKSFETLSILHTTMPDRLYAQNYNIESYILWFTLCISIFLYGLHHFNKRDIHV